MVMVTPPPNGKRSAGGGFNHDEGTLGPNGLKRMVGGNPAGETCNRWKTKSGCNFPTCSFKHGA